MKRQVKGGIQIVWLCSVCVMAQDRQPDICSYHAEVLRTARSIDRHASAQFAQIIKANAEVFSDMTLMEFQLSGWNGRLQWSQKNAPMIKGLFAQLNPNRSLKCVVALFGEITIIVQPGMNETGRILFSPCPRSCAPYDEIMATAGMECDGLWIWRGDDRPPDWLWDIKFDTDTTYVCAIHLEQKFKLVYVFSGGATTEAFEKLWISPQALEMMDLDKGLGRIVKTKQYIPDSSEIRILERDLPFLEKGVMTDDFTIGLPRSKKAEVIGGAAK